MILKINDKDIKFGYGLYFIGKALKDRETDLTSLLNDVLAYPISEMVDLMYFSAKCEAELDEVDLGITKREFLEFLDIKNDFQNKEGVLAKWSKGLTESIQGNFLPKQESNEEDTVSVEEKKS